MPQCYREEETEQLIFIIAKVVDELLTTGLESKKNKFLQQCHE